MGLLGKPTIFLESPLLMERIRLSPVEGGSLFHYIIRLS